MYLEGGLSTMKMVLKTCEFKAVKSLMRSQEDSITVYKLVRVFFSSFYLETN